MDHYAPGFRFHRLTIVEKEALSATVLSALEKELPFADIEIPASGPVLKAVGLGIMLAFFLAVGIVPDNSALINLH